jgi:hypothetical protein
MRLQLRHRTAESLLYTDGSSSAKSAAANSTLTLSPAAQQESGSQPEFGGLMPSLQLLAQPDITSLASGLADQHYHSDGSAGAGHKPPPGASSCFPEDAMNYQPNYEGIPPMSPYQPGPGPGGQMLHQQLGPGLQMQMGYPGTPGPQSHLPSYAMPPPMQQQQQHPPMQSMSPNFQQQGAIFPPPGLNMINQNSPFSHRRGQSLPPPGMMGPGSGPTGMSAPPFVSQPELRIQEMNKRLLSMRAEVRSFFPPLPF